MTVGSDSVIQQIINQLNKLIDVVSVENLTLGEHLERELVLLKLRVRLEHADAVRGYVARTGGRVLDPAAEGFIVELTASEAEINAFVAELSRQAELLEVARSGALGMGRARGQTQKLRIIEMKSRPGAETLLTLLRKRRRREGEVLHRADRQSDAAG